MTLQLQTVEIDLSSVESVEQLHLLFQETFRFPSFYGQNWDAFWDSITGLVELPHRIRFVGWQNFKSRFPHDAHIMEKCFRDYRRELGDSASEIEYT